MNNKPLYNAPISYLHLNNAAKALELYEKAFGAIVVARINYPNDENKILHACMKFGEVPVFISDTNPEKGCGTASNTSYYMHVEDADASFDKAKKAGLEEISAPQDMFWGDRMGTLKDAFGITWSLAQRKQEIPLDEIKRIAKQQGQAA